MHATGYCYIMLHIWTISSQLINTFLYNCTSFPKRKSKEKELYLDKDLLHYLNN